MQTETNNNSNPTPEGEEKLLCCCCMFPNESSVYFCSNCGAPLGWFSTIGPFESVFSEGYIVRRAIENPHSALILIGVWLIFLPLLLYSPVLFFAREMSNPVLGAILFLLSTAILYKVTRNYFKASKINKANSNLPES